MKGKVRSLPTLTRNVKAKADNCRAQGMQRQVTTGFRFLGLGKA